MSKKILIVDDEPSILSGLSKALCKVCNFQGEIKTVDNGNDALKEIIHCFYDICFLDINLPDLNGLDVMKKVQKISPGTRVVVMTADAIDEDMKRTIEETASLFITKPLDLSQIKAFINHVIGEGKKEFIEKRRFERRPFRKTINYFMNVFDGGELLKLNLRANTSDLGREGMGMWADYPLEPSHVLRFNDADIEYIAGVVRWSKMVDERYMVGIQFV